MPDSEFALIERYFAGTKKTGSVIVGVGEDGAVLQLPPGDQLVTSVDTLVSGVHFLPDIAADQLARRALRVNLSDLAAMGAKPLGFTLALTMPAVDETWLELFSQGLSEDAAIFGCPLVGGDTTAGPLTISISVFGSVPAGQALMRSGAGIGDHIFVTGALGDAAAALSIIKGLQISAENESEYLLNRFFRPNPRLKEGEKLRGIATAAVDISDGLLADLGHIARQSGVGAEVFADKLPLSKALSVMADQQSVVEWALTGGDDYELCFTVADKQVDLVHAMVSLGEIEAVGIGRIVEDDGVKCVDSSGNLLEFDHVGYQHF